MLTKLPLSSLRPHELSIKDHVDELVSSIRAHGALQRPLVVEADSLVVLDGTHRLAALRQLGASRVPVVLVRYDHVRLEGWVRVYEMEALPDLRRIAEVDEVRRLPSGATLVKLGGGADAYYDLVRLEDIGHRLLKAVTWRTALGLGGDLLLVLPPKPTKDLVLRAAGTGRLLPPRSTRHLTEAKKVRLRTPLSALIRGR
ncbi:MAG: ParB N-terminal domain-containing protein [Acidilobus sp.]